MAKGMKWETVKAWGMVWESANIGGLDVAIYPPLNSPTQPSRWEWVARDEFGGVRFGDTLPAKMPRAAVRAAVVETLGAAGIL